MRLFDNGHAFCREQALSDLGLKRWLSAVLNGDLQPLYTFLCTAPDDAERTQRRALLRGVADNGSEREFLRAVQAEAHGLLKLKQLYSTADILYHFRYAQSYTASVRRLATMDVGEDDTHSERFRRLVRTVRREAQSEAFCALADAVDATLSSLEEWRSAAVCYQVTEGALSSAARIPSVQEPLFSASVSTRLSRLFGDTVSETPRPLALAEADRCLRHVCDEAPTVRQQLEATAANAAHYPYLSMQAVSQDIRIIWTLLALLNALRDRGIPLCDATVGEYEPFSVTQGYDFTLTDRTEAIVPNDFHEADRLTLLQGANSGGKTAFLRMVGLCTAFAMWGLPVPAVQMRCPVIHTLHTVFTAPESASEGRLAGEQERLTVATQAMDAHTLLLVNELFSSTSEADAVSLSQASLDRIGKAEAWCLWNTHHTSLLPSLDRPCATYAPLVDEDGTRRYVIRRQAPAASGPADIAADYGLTAERLTARFRSRGIL